MPDWLVILLLMGLVIVAIQPAPAGFAWYQGLRRPAWFRWHLWQPLLRPLGQLGLYASVLLVHGRNGIWLWVWVYLLLLAIAEAALAIVCWSHQLVPGCLIALLGWIGGLALLVAVRPLSLPAALLLLPFLLVTPLEVLVQWQMIPLLGPGSSGPGPAPGGAQAPQARPRPRTRRPGDR